MFDLDPSRPSVDCEEEWKLCSVATGGTIFWPTRDSRWCV